MYKKATSLRGRIAGAVCALAMGACVWGVASPAQAYADDEVFSDTWERLAGPIALDTMKEIANEGWSEGSEYAVVATADGYWDALSASAVAGLHNAPILMTSTKSLSDQTKAALADLKVKKVILCGGEAAVSDDVKKQIEAMNISVERVSGADAIETSVKLADKLGDEHGETCLIATNATFQDALACAPCAYTHTGAVYLADGSTLKLTDQALESIKAAGYKKAVIAGGTAALSDEVEKQLKGIGVTPVRKGGATCYETATELALGFELEYDMGLSNMGVATGQGFHDALAGAALCGKKGSVLVLADERNSEAALKYLGKDAQSVVIHGYIFGGEAAVGEEVKSDINDKAPFFKVYRTTRAGEFTSALLNKADFMGLKSDSTAPQSGMYYKNGGWNVTTAATYVTLDDLFKAAGEAFATAWKPGATLVYEGKGSTRTQRHTFEEVTGGKFFPKTVKGEGVVDGAVGVVPCLSLTFAKGAVAEGSTAGDAQAANVAKANDKASPTILFGISDQEATSNDAAGMKYWNNVRELTIEVA